MTINDVQAYMAGVWDWAILEGCFGPKMRLTDQDGRIERHGYFLVIEAKQPGVRIPWGQQIALQAEVQTGYTTVIVVWGNTDNPQKFEVWTRRGVDRYPEGNIEELRRVCADWYAWANSHKARYFEMETYGGEKPQREYNPVQPFWLDTDRNPTDGRSGQAGYVSTGD